MNYGGGAFALPPIAPDGWPALTGRLRSGNRGHPAGPLLWPSSPVRRIVAGGSLSHNSFRDGYCFVRSSGKHSCAYRRRLSKVGRGRRVAPNVFVLRAEAAKPKWRERGEGP